MNLSTGRTVLVVEDQDDLRALMLRTLAGEGYRVLEARDGVEALEVLEAEPDVSLIVTDILMPRMDGLELAEHLGSQSHALILFMSGYSSHGAAVPGPFLPKPFSPVTLCAEVQRLLAPSRSEA
jgi:CheY-like chemotaxis protein